MPSSRKTFRLFVSSTFSDMGAERGFLQREVFPKLKSFCQARGADFQAIDLRWGVSEDTQLDQKTMRLCLVEIGRCQRLSPRPNFLVLLGDRYGWEPIPEAIPSLEMEQILDALDADTRKRIERWYREDLNAVPHEHVLLPRGGEFAEFGRWGEESKNLLEMLRGAVDSLGFDEAARVKYFASATHQEIVRGALRPPEGVPTPEEHVLACVRGLDVPDPQASAGDARTKLEGLKAELRELIPAEHMLDYRASATDDGTSFTLHDGDAFAGWALDRLRRLIEAELEGAVVEERSEARLHGDFQERLCKHFVGRESALKSVASHLESRGMKPLLLLGPSGSGKSSVMAMAAKRAKAAGWKTTLRFVGLTSAATNAESLILSVCAELVDVLDRRIESFLEKDDGKEPRLDDPRTLRKLLEAILEAIPEDSRVVIFLDALDQIEGGTKSALASMLPTELPASVRLVMSALPEWRDELAGSRSVEQKPMTGIDGASLLHLWLADAGRALQPKQEAAILGRFKGAGLPLHLRLAFEKARGTRSFEVLDPGTDVEGALSAFFDELEGEHGDLLVRKTVSFLLAGRHGGLKEEELVDLLAFDAEHWEAFVERSHPEHREELKLARRLPIAVWSRLYLDLEPYLSERDAEGESVLAFFHRQFREYAAKRYAVDLAPAHDVVARFFEAKPLYFDEAEHQPDRRKATEQAWQEMRSGRWDELVELSLGSFPFVMAKFKAELGEQAIGEYRAIEREAPAATKARMRIWSAYFREKAHILRRRNGEWPGYKILLQVAVEHADDSPVTIGAEKWLEEGKCDWRWLRRNRRVGHGTAGNCLAVFEGHTSGVNGALLRPDGSILSWSDDNTLRLWSSEGDPLRVLEGHFNQIRGAILRLDGSIMSWSGESACLWSEEGDRLRVLKEITMGALIRPDGSILSWSWENTLRLWSIEGKPLYVLKGHIADLTGALLGADGSILSWSDDGTLRLWSEKGQPLYVLQGHTAKVTGALLRADGSILSWSQDKTLRLWSSQGHPLRVLRGHTEAVDGAFLLSDGSIISWSYDGTLRHWNTKGEALRVLEGHIDGVIGALLRPDDSIISWSWDKTLIHWRVEGEPLAVLFGHTEKVIGALIRSDNSILSWSTDGTLRLWSEKGQPLRILKGHAGEVEGALIRLDGSILSWSSDHTLRLWSTEGAPLRIIEGHSKAIQGTLIRLDGSILSWSQDGSLRFWSAEGEPLCILEGHTESVNDVLIRPNGSILSWSTDNTLRLWSTEGQLLRVLEGHTDLVLGTISRIDGSILSWSRDGTLRLWSAEGESLCVLEGHTGIIWDARVRSDGSILSWSYDNNYDETLRQWRDRGQLRLWSAEGQTLRVLEGHKNGIVDALIRSDNSILSWSPDGTLRLWSEKGQLLRTLKGHTAKVTGALLRVDGSILSWSQDKTLRLWSAKGELLDVLKGHTESVWCALLRPDGSILSWSDDNTLRLWSSEGDPLRVLEGHTKRVDFAFLRPDNSILSWSADDTIRLWSPEGELLASFGMLEARKKFPELSSESRRAGYWHSFAEGRVSSGISDTRNAKAYYWHAESDCNDRHLFPDGRLVVTQENGQICFLRLYEGNKMIALDGQPVHP